MDGVLLAQQSWIRAFDSKFKICSIKLINFRICYKALKDSPDYNSKRHIDQTEDFKTHPPAPSLFEREGGGRNSK